MGATIRRVRVSLFWSRHFGALLGTSPPPGAPMGFLARRGPYKDLFDALAPHAPPLPPPSSAGPLLERPWPSTGTNRFWRRYLGASALADVKGGSAWGRLVPLRRHEAPAGKLQAALPPGLSGAEVEVAQSEALFHAHAVTFALHVTVAGEMQPEAMAEACVGLRLGKAFVRAGAAGGVRADDLADDQLSALSREALGAPGPGVAGPGIAYSLVTVLDGEGVDPTEKIAEGGAVHRALEAVTRWSATWQLNALPPLQDGRIATRRAPEGHILYGRGSGRAVWEPWGFLPSNRGKTSLSCYHRNLFVGMLQTEALLRFARLTEDAAAAGHLSATQDELAPAAVQQLFALHAGGTPTTSAYRSDCLRVLIDQHPLRSSVNALAARLGLEGRLPT